MPRAIDPTPRTNAHDPAKDVSRLRAAPAPAVSAPVTWQEIQTGAGLWSGPDELRERVREHGDLFAPLLELRQRLP